ncbi:MAG: DUF4976 domain-containing protein [Bdellovibrionaceae bacterium]|nr:DUF4976 domain-containing protein [Pseudobdellovibrionaceae bacterium]
MDLAGIKHPPHLDGRSLYPLLQDPDREWDHPAISTYNAHLSIASEEYRYIRYTDGTEELYDRTIDPHEWNNLADDVAYRGVKNHLNSLLPAPGEMAPDFASDNVIGSLTLDLNVQSTGPGGGYIQFSPKSMEGIGIVPMPETPGPLTVNAMFRANRTITVTPVNYRADWQIGGGSEQGTLFVQASNQTIAGTLNYGSDLGSAYSAWSTFYGGDGVIGAASYDFDRDGDSNYKEYSVGGDPTDPADTGVKPTLVFEGENVRLNVPQRTDDPNLAYYIESIPNLKNKIWDTNQYLTSEVESSGGPLDIVSYLYPLKVPASFFRVIVESD